MHVEFTGDINKINLKNWKSLKKYEAWDFGSYKYENLILTQPPNLSIVEIQWMDVIGRTEPPDNLTTIKIGNGVRQLILNRFNITAYANSYKIFFERMKNLKKKFESVHLELISYNKSIKSLEFHDVMNFVKNIVWDQTDKIILKLLKNDGSKEKIIECLNELNINKDNFTLTNDQLTLSK